MTLTPMSILTLYSNIPLDPNYNFTLDFDSLSAQETYFDSKVAQVLEEDTDYSFIRASEELKVQAHVDDLLSVNYLSFYNKSKKYYAFITSKRYISETCTGITFKLDVMQSFMFDYTIKESFVERQHEDRYEIENNAIVRKFNNISENLDYGSNYVVKGKTEFEGKRGHFASEDSTTSSAEIIYAIITATPDSNNKGLFGEDIPAKTTIGGLPSPFILYVLPFDITNESTIVTIWESGTRSPMAKFSDVYNRIKNNEKVINIGLFKYLPFYSEFEVSQNDIPLTFHDIKIGNTQHPVGYRKIVVSSDIGNIINVYSYDTIGLFHVKDIVELQTTLPKAKTTTYTPNINSLYNYLNETKIYTNPYRYLILSNSGENKIIPYEKCNGNKIRYNADLESGSKQYFEIYNLNGDTYGIQESMTDNKINSLPLTTNAWLQYLLNQKASVQSGLTSSGATTAIAEVGGLISIVSGIATANPALILAGVGAMAGGAVSHISKVDSVMANEKSIKQLPETQKAGNNIHFDGIQNNVGLTYYVMSAEDRYLKRIADYFNHFGYKVGDFITPNLKSRYYFNYIKTIGINIETNIDSGYRDELVNIYDKGVTIWHYRDATTFKGVNNYSYENVEMSLIGG